MASSNKDNHLKMQVSSIFRRIGYIVFTEIDLSAYCYQDKYVRKNVTDFDVLGVNVEPDLGKWYAIAECKTAKSQAMEKLLKLNGIKEFFNTQKAYFIQQDMDANAREIGSACGIWCLDAKNLNMMMKSLNVNEKPDVEIETKIYNERNNLLKEQKEDFPSQTTYLRYDYWTLPDYRNIMNLIPLMKQMKDKLDEAKKSHTILVHQLLTAFALSSLGLTGSLIKKNIDDFPNGLLTALTGGSRERRDREALFDMIGKMLPEKELSFVPDFFNNYAELVNRYKNITLYSHRIASCLTDITRNLLVSDVKEIEGHIEDQYNEKTIKLSRDTMYFAIKNMNISENVFSHFLKVG